MAYHFSDAVRDIKRGRMGRKKLANETYLYPRGEGKFVVKLYSTDVVEIYPEYQVLSMGGHQTQITMRIINQFSAASNVHPNSRLGYDENMRIGSYPFFDGIRIDNCGRVFKEDIKSDWKQAVRPEVVQAWKALHMPVGKALRGRFDLGEFDEGWDHEPSEMEALRVLERMDRTFPDHDDVMCILSLSILRVRAAGWNKPTHTRTPQERWLAALGKLRLVYYRQNDAYMTVEVKNV